MSVSLPAIDANNFRTLIRSKRERLGFTKNDMAVRLHCSPRYVAKLEDSPSTFPSPKMCGQLAHVLSLDEEQLRAAVIDAQNILANARTLERARLRATRYKITSN